MDAFAFHPSTRRLPDYLRHGVATTLMIFDVGSLHSLRGPFVSRCLAISWGAASFDVVRTYIDLRCWVAPRTYIEIYSRCFAQCLSAECLLALRLRTRFVRQHFLRRYTGLDFIFAPHGKGPGLIFEASLVPHSLHSLHAWDTGFSWIITVDLPTCHGVSRIGRCDLSEICCKLLS